MKGRSTWIVFCGTLCVAWLISFPAACQEKLQPTFDQIFKNGEPRFERPLPDITGWADDVHYLETKKKEGDAHPKVYRIEAENGHEEIGRDLWQYKDLLPEGVDPASPAAASQDYSVLIYQKDNDLYAFDAARKECKRLTTSGTEQKNPTLSPDGKFVAFTRANDLYAIELATGREHRYTSDGTSTVYNGWASWLYYEEILGRASRYRAFWWSPDSKQIAFYRFDDSQVPVFPIFNARGVHGSLELTRYPQPGDRNPEVRVGIVPAEGGPIVWGAFNPGLDQYFGMPFWTPDSKQLFVQWMNRAQDTILIYSVNPGSGARSLVYTEHQTSWVDWFSSITFLTQTAGFILKTDKDGWAHLYRFDMEGHPVNRITEGAWSVVDLLAVNESSGTVYFTGRKESSARIDLYRVPLAGGNPQRLTSGPYYNKIHLSPRGTYFIASYSNQSTPTKMSLYRGTGALMRELGDSKSPEFDRYELGRSEFFRIPTSDGIQLPATWTLPMGFDQSKKYPVIISIYGGPDAPTAWDSWPGIQRQWLAHEGAIQMSVDHRGSGHFGKEGVALMYRNLGTWEMHDYIEAVKWLRRQPFVDSTRICITGGSYGGYVTCLALTEGADYFPYGIADFPVTDWMYYDSHYVERYMDLPEENPEGYRKGSVFTYVNRYKGLLEIVHGTMDDNVHTQNTIQLIDTLEVLNKHFIMYLYPGERHGWGGPKAGELRNETYRFYYRYLLGKEFPADLFSSIGVVNGMRRRRP